VSDGYNRRPTTRAKRKVTAAEGARLTGLSERHVARLVAQSRDEWLIEQAARRERIRAYHDDEGHSWSETAKHFGVSDDTVMKLGYRARKERAAERETAENARNEALNPPLF